MADIVYIAVALAFFALCVAYIRGLDRIVRSAEAADTFHEEADAAHEVAASSADNWIGLGLAVLLVGYLVAALVFPEKF